MRVLKFLLILLILILPLGQFGRLPLGEGDVVIYLNDLLLPLMVIFWFFYSLIIKKSFKLPPLFLSIIIFILITLITLAYGKKDLAFNNFIISGLYLVRWISYAGIYFVLYSLIVDSKNPQREVKLFCHLLVLITFILGVLGLAQFAIFPDFSKMVKHGWDPHYYRVLSTFFDPNYMGGFFVLSLNLILSLTIFSEKKNFYSKWLYLISGGVIFIAILLTFSRSTYLMLLISLGLLGSLKSKKLLMVGFLSLVLAFLLIPRVQERIYGAVVNLDQSAKARLISWENGLMIAEDNFLTGVGYNSYRYAQIRYGFIEPWDPELGGHSGSGTDSSFLLILATTGLFGLLAYLGIYFLAILSSANQVFKREKQKLKAKALKSEDFLFKALNLTLLCGLLGLFGHSFFVNSLLYPFIMEWVWIVLGLRDALANQSEQVTTNS